MSYTLILFGPVVWSRGPAQVWGIATLPYVAYKYCNAKDEKEVEEICKSFKFNMQAMIPIVGTWVAINSGDYNQREKISEEK